MYGSADSAGLVWCVCRNVDIHVQHWCIGRTGPLTYDARHTSLAVSWYGGVYVYGINMNSWCYGKNCTSFLFTQYTRRQ